MKVPQVKVMHVVFIVHYLPNYSVDSRSFGPIPYALIQSRVFYRVSTSSCVYKIQWNLRIKDGTVVCLLSRRYSFGALKSVLCM